MKQFFSMDLMNNIKGKIMTAFTILVLGIAFLFAISFRKVNDAFVIDQVILQKLILVQDSLDNCTLKVIDKEQKGARNGIGITIKKKYLPSEDSKRVFLSSMEPGLNGLKGKIENFNLILTCGKQTYVIDSLLYTEALKLHKDDLA